MEIDKTLRLSDKQYYSEEHKKTQIVLGNTLGTNLSHFDLWTNKINGKFKGTAPYTIGIDGTIYEHYDPKYYSDFLSNSESNKNIIPIVIENLGWLNKDYTTNKFYTWCGDEYPTDDPFIDIKWRGKLRWVPYNLKQLNSTTKLCNDLIDRFGIDRFVSSHNTKIPNISEKLGIYYKSNYSINYLDVSPAFKFKNFKTKIEK